MMNTAEININEININIINIYEYEVNIKINILNNIAQEYYSISGIFHLILPGFFGISI